MKRNTDNSSKHKSGAKAKLRIPVTQRLIAELSILSQSLSMSSSPLFPSSWKEMPKALTHRGQE